MSRVNLLFWLMALCSLIIAAVTLRAIPLGVEAAFPVLRANPDAGRMVFVTHVIAAPMALVVALPQFFARLRTRFPAVHRTLGVLYATAILAGGVSGLLLAISAWPARPVAAVGFAVLAVCWLGMTGYAVHLVLNHQIARHHKWMIRSFALTFAAVTLRLQLPVYFATGMEYPEASNWVAWTCWVPNLIVAEWMLRRAPTTQRTVRVA